MLPATSARGQLEPLLCRHRAINNNTQTSFEFKQLSFLHDLASLAATILGESTVGSHVSVLTDILDAVPEEELSVFVDEATLCTFGFVNGLAMSSCSLASVAMAYPALQLTRQLAIQLLQHFETVRPGTDVFFATTCWGTGHIG